VKPDVGACPTSVGFEGIEISNIRRPPLPHET